MSKKQSNPTPEELGATKPAPPPAPPNNFKRRNEQMKFEDMALDSSNLKSISYDGETKILIIEFHGGNRYQYKEVPEEIITKWLSSESKGKFFHGEIKNKYLYEKISSREEKELEDAIKKVMDFLDKKGYNKEREILKVSKEKEERFFVTMNKPEGLFIVMPDGSVEDNYNIFSEQYGE